MANRRPQQGGGGRRMEFNRNDRKNYGRAGVSPWQGGGPGANLPALLPPLAAGSTEATLALASNIINLLQPRQNPVPSLLDMPIRRDFVPNMGRFDRSYGPNRMGNQGYFRRTGNYNRAGERINTNRKQFKPNDGLKQQNKSSPKKEADSKAKPVKESDDTKPSDDKEDRKEAPKTRYDDINPQLLKCHICNKSMWDGRSFENHLSGRAHAIMMQKTAESYALTADTMRQEFKIREMKRTRKSGQQPARDFYCAMCDMYAADGAAHRTTVGHRKLKKYLHPTCTSCHKEMPTRIELDEHRLTAEHLKNMQDKQEVVIKPKPEVMVISTLSMEQSYLRDDRQRRRRHDDRDHEDRDHDLHNHNHEDDQVEVKKEPGEGDGENEAVGEVEKKEKSPMDKEDTILDYKEGDDLSHVTSEMLPTYSTERGVGASFLSEFRCFQCSLCHKLLDSEETAQVHLRTWKHHQLFIRSLQPQKEIGMKRSMTTDDDGTWKRRKMTTDDDNEADGEHNGHEDTDVKAEVQNSGEDVDGDGDGEGDGDAEMPAADELEDWEQSVDEILDDEMKNHDNDDDKEQPQEQQEQVETPEEKEELAPPPSPPAAPAPAPAPAPEETPRGSPRGRGRGRGGRGRGRY